MWLQLLHCISQAGAALTDWACLADIQQNINDILVVNLFLAVGRRSGECRGCGRASADSLARHFRKSIRVERRINEVSVALHVWQRLPDDVRLIEKALVGSQNKQLRLSNPTVAVSEPFYLTGWTTHGVTYRAISRSKRCELSATRIGSIYSIRIHRDAYTKDVSIEAEMSTLKLKKQQLLITLNSQTQISCTFLPSFQIILWFMWHMSQCQTATRQNTEELK